MDPQGRGGPHGTVLTLTWTFSDTQLRGCKCFKRTHAMTGQARKALAFGGLGSSPSVGSQRRIVGEGSPFRALLVPNSPSCSSLSPSQWLCTGSLLSTVSLRPPLPGPLPPAMQSPDWRLPALATTTACLPALLLALLSPLLPRSCPEQPGPTRCSTQREPRGRP